MKEEDLIWREGQRLRIKRKTFEIVALDGAPATAHPSTATDGAQPPLSISDESPAQSRPQSTTADEARRKFTIQERIGAAIWVGIFVVPFVIAAFMANC